MKPLFKLRDSQFEATSEAGGRNAWRSRATEDNGNGWQPIDKEDQWIQVNTTIHTTVTRFACR